MTEILLYGNDFIDWRALCKYKQEDIDSGCSSLPPSPGNMSDFSGSTSFDEFSDDLLISKNDALAMGTSILQGGPVLNPYIKVKTEDCKEIDNFEELLPSNDDLLEMFMNDVELFKDSSLFDSEENAGSCKPNNDNSDSDYAKSNFEKKELECVQNPTVMDAAQKSNIKKEQYIEKKTITKPRSTRKRALLNANVNVEHSYSCKQQKLNDSEASEDNNSSKDDKYLEKRRKNNLAAKKSREIKRAKEIENLKKCDKLAKENESLQKEMKKLQALVTRLEGKLKNIEK